MAGGREFNRDRFENLVLYLSERSEEDEGFGKVKLNKLLFRADFEAYRLLGQSITGEEYKREELGPVAAHLPSLLKRFRSDGVMTVEEIPAGPHPRKVPTPTGRRGSDSSLFSPAETQIIERAIAELRERGAKAVSRWSHEVSVGWRVKTTGQIIPYSSAPLSIRQLSPKGDRALKARFARAS